MNRLARRWVAALRSGKYRQGQGGLRTGDRYCCLGVLCDLADPEGWEELGSRGEYFHRTRSAYPRDDIISAVGLDGAHLFPSDVAGWNDSSADTSFSEIADRLEEAYNG